MMENALAKDFNFRSLLAFALPTMATMLIMSLYTIVDGVFVSRFVGTDALSAVNIVYPVINIILAVSIMLGTGGSAVIARRMGEGKMQLARENLTFILLSGLAIVILVAVGGIAFINLLVRMLGANEVLAPLCRDYLLVLLLFSPASALQLLFQTFFVAAGRPGAGLALTVAAGLVNAVFDYILIVPCGLGVTGAAIATGMGYLVPAVYGLWFFTRKKNLLHLTKPRADWRALLESCLNGSSEMVTNLSTGVVTLLFNLIMIRMLGSDGVAAITIVMYAQFLLTALYIGFSMGVAPVVSYNYGSGDIQRLKRIFRICMTAILVTSVATLICSFWFAPAIVGIFSPKGTLVFDIALRGFYLFSVNYLFAGLNIFASSLFTALSNGPVSALISFMRTFGFVLVGLLLLPPLLQVDGVWLIVPFAEVLTMLVSVWMLQRGKRQYHYA